MNFLAAIAPWWFWYTAGIATAWGVIFAAGLYTGYRDHHRDNVVEFPKRRRRNGARHD